MKNENLRIGEFSKLMQVTVKTLRHYELIGILKPAEVDEWTGYRYYKLEQMQQLETIRNLKEIGFSLDEIKTIFAEGALRPDIGQLEAKIRKCEEELRSLIARRERLALMIDSQRKITQMDKISIQTLPSIIVASHREVIPNYQAIGPMCCNVIGPEMQHLGCKCPQPGYCFTFEHADEYTPTDIDIEYCEQVEEKGVDSDIIQFKVLPEVPTAVCIKHFGPYENLHKTYAELFKYVEKSGLKVVGKPRCSYVDGIWNEPDPEKWLTIVQLPVEK